MVTRLLVEMSDVTTAPYVHAVPLSIDLAATPQWSGDPSRAALWARR